MGGRFYGFKVLGEKGFMGGRFYGFKVLGEKGFMVLVYQTLKPLNP